MMMKFKKMIIRIIRTVCCIGVLFWATFQFALIVSKNKDRTVQKFKTYYLMMISWMNILENERSIGGYLKTKGYQKVAVYGVSSAGYHLLKQLKGTEVNVQYLIDRTVFSNELNFLPIYRPDDSLPETDAIIVTPIWDYQNIKAKLSGKINCPILSLSEVIEGVQNV